MSYYRINNGNIVGAINSVAIRIKGDAASVYPAHERLVRMSLARVLTHVSQAMEELDHADDNGNGIDLATMPALAKLVGPKQRLRTAVEEAEALVQILNTAIADARFGQ